MSILAEPPVTVVDKNAASHGATEVAKPICEYLYSPEGQKIVAKNYYRPSEPQYADEEVLEAVSRRSSCSRSTTCSAAGRQAQTRAFRRRRRVRFDLRAAAMTFEPRAGARDECQGSAPCPWPLHVQPAACCPASA